MAHGRKHTCPNCGGEMARVIYAGLPGRLCLNSACARLSGPAAFVAGLHFNGWFYVFEGSYFRALWAWLRGTATNDESEGK